MIDLPAPSSRDADKLRKIVTDIGNGEVDAFYLHLAEGQADNEKSRNEFGRLVDSYQACPRDRDHPRLRAHPRRGQCGQGDAGLVGLVFEEQFRRPVRPDDPGRRRAGAWGFGWARRRPLPSVHPGLPGRQGGGLHPGPPGRPLPPRRLVEMVTSTAADIAGLAGQLGSLEAGRPRPT